MGPVDLLVVVLATQRCLNMWFAEAIAATPRAWARRLPSPLGYLFACPYCLSVWVAAGCLALWTWAGPAGQFVVAALAVSGAALAWNAGFVVLSYASLRPQAAAQGRED